MTLVEIDLNMDMMYSDIDGGYKHQNEALSNLNVDTTDLVLGLNCCSNPPICEISTR